MHAGPGGAWAVQPHGSVRDAGRRRRGRRRRGGDTLDGGVDGRGVLGQSAELAGPVKRRQAQHGHAQVVGEGRDVARVRRQLPARIAAGGGFAPGGSQVVGASRLSIDGQCAGGAQLVAEVVAQVGQRQAVAHDVALLRRRGRGARGAGGAAGDGRVVHHDAGDIHG